MILFAFIVASQQLDQAHQLTRVQLIQNEKFVPVRIPTNIVQEMQKAKQTHVFVSGPTQPVSVPITDFEEAQFYGPLSIGTLHENEANQRDRGGV
jgi:hypothetical protein